MEFLFVPIRLLVRITLHNTQVVLAGREGTAEDIQGYNTLDKESGMVGQGLRVSQKMMGCLRINYWCTTDVGSANRLVRAMMEISDD